MTGLPALEMRGPTQRGTPIIFSPLFSSLRPYHAEFHHLMMGTVVKTPVFAMLVQASIKFP
jgi:hypothetical protein